MATLEEKLQVFQDHLSSAQTVVVAVPADVSYDKLATALAWADVIRMMGKSVTLVSPAQPKFQIQSQVQIQTEMGFRDLEVVFPYQAEAVEKVSYNIDEETQEFRLLIMPHKGNAPLSPEKVEYRYVGAEADLVILVGIHEYEQLSHLYEGYEQLFESTPSLTYHTFEPEIGMMHLEVTSGVSFSQYLVQLIMQYGWSVTGETASDLLYAIEEESQFFQSLTTTPETFEAVAYLMRLGAHRQRRQVPTASPAASTATVVLPGTKSTTVADFASALGKPKASPITEAATLAKSTRKKKTKATLNGDVGEVEDMEHGSLKYQPSGMSPGGQG